MLDEKEWTTLRPASPQAKLAILDRYFELTGFRETNINAVWHHRLSLYGPPCEACGKPLRTPKASFCAACGAPASRSAE
jgi:hypothetical protein